VSTWHVLAIERLGAPAPSWPSIFGPAEGPDPVAANGLHTLDLTPFLAPVEELSTQLDADLVKGSTSELQLDLVDADASLSAALGPNGTLAAAGRYFGPWIEVWERWGEDSSALRFRGYLDESSLQWSEEEALTQATVIHASQLLRERLVTDFAELLRPWPSVPTNSSQSFNQSTADDLLRGAVGSYVPRVNKSAIETALWASGQLSWKAMPRSRETWKTIERPDFSDPTRYFDSEFQLPDVPASTLVIGGTSYAVARLEWDTTVSAAAEIGDVLNGSRTTYNVVRVVLQGAPDVSAALHVGDTVVWGVPESRRTHYVLAGGPVIVPPVDGSDGEKFVKLTTVEQLVPGDVLTLAFVDATSGAPRTLTEDLPTIIDVDGETGKVYFAEPLSKGYSHISKIRRNSQDPVLFDGLAYAQALTAPFGLDLSQFQSAPTDVPVLTWLPYDMATPPLYGVHCIQTTAQRVIRAGRRGPDNGTGVFPVAGVWARSVGETWSWLGADTADATHRVFGDVNQWPDGTNAYTAPVIYIEGDLSAMAATPPNGWRPCWRTWKSLSTLTQDPESSWDGSAVDWGPVAASGDIPAKLVAFAASAPTPGRYVRLAAGAWTFEAHTGNGVLGAPVTPTITGSLPTGNWIAMGLGIWGSAGDDKEAVLGLVVTGTTFPFAAVRAVMLSRASGGSLTLLQDAALWATGGAPAGPWALGGGLVVQTYAQTFDGLTYPTTVLHRLDGATVSSATFRTLEIIPQTIQPLRQIQVDGEQKIAGWYALALETFADDNYAPARRLRFLHLNRDLTILNGSPEADPANPNDILSWFVRGEIVSSIVPDGSLLASMVRLDQTSDDMVGLFGGRLFQVARSLPKTVERLAIGAEIQAGQFSIAGSGDGITVADYLEQLAGAQLASVVPTAAGGFRLVSRSAGAFQLRTFGAERVSVRASERGPRTQSEVWAGYIRKVRVTYSDPLAGSTATIEVMSGQAGGRVLEVDHSTVLTSPTMARALGVAAAFWFGTPVQSLQETWVDRTGGLFADLPPTWWADWQVGDLVTFESSPSGSPTDVTAWKVMALNPGPETRSARVELRKMPSLISTGAP